MRSRLLIIRGLTFVFLTAWIAPFSYAEPWGNVYDELFERHRERVVTVKNPDGSETRSVELPGKVHLHQTRKEDDVTTVGMDRSGLGAIICSWWIFVELKVELEACPNSSTEEVRNRMNMALARTNEFILEHSFPPTSYEALEGYISKKVSTLSRRKKNPKNWKNGRCLSDFASKFSASVEALTREAFEKEIEKALSVPRLPVASPCL